MSAAGDALALFAGIGQRLWWFAADPSSCALGSGEVVAVLPGNVQYACSNVSGERLYVVSSDGGPGSPGSAHHLSAFRIDWALKRLEPLCRPTSLRHRPIHIATDRDSSHALIAYNSPSTVTVHELAANGAVNDEVPQPDDLDTGMFAHQMYVACSNRTAILVTRGYDASATTPERPGALKVFHYDRGRLTNRASIAPNGGYGFGPRNVDVDPSGKWLYASLERQNRLDVFAADGEVPVGQPAFRCETLREPRDVRPMQMAGAVHLHPSGRFVYLANRAFGTVGDGAARVFAGGENTIVVFEVDAVTGTPRPIQAVDTGGIYARTFSIDPAGRMLVAGNSTALPVRDGQLISLQPANLAVFAIGEDGTLTAVRCYEIPDTGDKLFWSALVSAPAGGA